MTVDLLAATFWPEAALLGARPAHVDAPEPAPQGSGGEADEADRREGFWSALLRHLWIRAEASAMS